MYYIWMAIIGFVVGTLVRAALPPERQPGIAMTTLLGVSGAFMANALALNAGLYTAGASTGFLVSMTGAGMLLLVRGNLSQKVY